MIYIVETKRSNGEWRWASQSTDRQHALDTAREIKQKQAASGPDGPYGTAVRIRRRR